jgi:CubicO group peptidase (beta-lactamase class C family)
VHPPGRYSSYNNAGYTVAGRVIEVLTGKTWHQALRDEILEPAGLRDSISLPEEALLRRAAVGHRLDDSGQLVIHQRWRLPHAIAAAGSCLCTTAADLVRFGLLHLRQGRTADGTEILSRQSVAEMQRRQATQTGGAGRGLGWNLGLRAGSRSLSHGGGTLGQSSNLVVLPDAGIVMGTVTNGPGGHAVISGIESWSLNELGLTEPPAGSADGGAANTVRLDVDAARFVGTYRRLNVETTIALEGTHLVWSSRYTGTLAEILPSPPPIRLVPVDELKLATVGPDGNPTAGYIEFFEPDDSGRPLYVLAGHVAKRVPAGD